MHLFFTTKPFQYYDKSTDSMVTTSSKIPIFINDEGKLDNIVNDYLLTKTIHSWNADSNTPKTNAEHLLSFLEFCELKIQKEWTTIPSGSINYYIVCLIKKKNSELTINVKLNAISSLFKWACDNNHISSNPFDNYEIKNTIKNTIKFTNDNNKFNVSESIERENIPTIDDVFSFYRCLNKEDQLIAKLLINTGLRKDELYQLTVDMIRNAKKCSYGKSYYVYLDSSSMRIKNNKSRYIIISENMRISLLTHSLSEISKYRKQKFYQNNNFDTDLLFISSQGNKYSSDKLNKSFHKASILSGYFAAHGKAIHPHQLRHFYAYTFIRKKEQDGADMDNVFIDLSNFLGNSSHESTKEFYLKIVSNMKQFDSSERFEEFFISFFEVL